MRAVSFVLTVVAVSAVGLTLAARDVQAQAVVHSPPPNTVSLNAGASVELVQDVLAITLSTTRDGPDAAAVQAGLRQALDAALAATKPQVVPGAMDLRSGDFRVYPRYDRQGKINGWMGNTELVLEGKDFARISAAAGKVQTMNVQHMGFSLSKQSREKAEGQVQAEAIARFRDKADTIAKQFGFSGYTLREVMVSSADNYQPQRPRMMAMEMKTASSDAPIPVEAGKTAVNVVVNGSVVLK